jgi:hypothetical protein
MRLLDHRTRVRQPERADSWTTVPNPVCGRISQLLFSANGLLPGGKGPGRKTYRFLPPVAKLTVHTLTGSLFISMATCKKSMHKLILKSNYTIFTKSLRSEQFLNSWKGNNFKKNKFSELKPYSLKDIMEIISIMFQLKSSCSEGRHFWGTQPRAWVSRWINNQQIQRREPESVYRIKRSLSTWTCMLQLLMIISYCIWKVYICAMAVR